MSLRFQIRRHWAQQVCLLYRCGFSLAPLTSLKNSIVRAVEVFKVSLPCLAPPSHALPCPTGPGRVNQNPFSSCLHRNLFPSRESMPARFVEASSAAANSVAWSIARIDDLVSIKPRTSSTACLARSLDRPRPSLPDFFSSFEPGKEEWSRHLLQLDHRPRGPGLFVVKLQLLLR